MITKNDDYFKKMIEIENQKDIEKYGITLFDEFSAKDEVKYNEAIYRKIEKQKIDKIFVGNSTRNRKEHSIYITNITALSWHELQTLQIRGNDALTKMVNLYNIFGYAFKYEMILENRFGSVIIQKDNIHHGYSSYIVELSKDDLPKIERNNILKQCGFSSKNNDVQASLSNLIITLEEWGINEKEIVEFICKLKTALTKQNAHALNTRIGNIRKSGGNFMELYNFALYLNLFDSTKGN